MNNLTSTEAKRILGLADNFTADQLKKNYRKLARRYHPDNGGDDEKMKMLNEAKDVLENHLKNGGSFTGTNTSYHNTYRQEYRNETNYSRTSYSSNRTHQDSIFEQWQKWREQEEKANETFNSGSNTSNTSYDTNQNRYNKPTTGYKEASFHGSNTELNKLKHELNKILNSGGKYKTTQIIYYIYRVIIILFIILGICYLYKQGIGEKVLTTLFGTSIDANKLYKLMAVVFVGYVIISSYMKFKFLGELDKSNGLRFETTNGRFDNSYNTFINVNDKKYPISRKIYSPLDRIFDLAWGEMMQSDFIYACYSNRFNRSIEKLKNEKIRKINTFKGLALGTNGYVFDFNESDDSVSKLVILPGFWFIHNSKNGITDIESLDCCSVKVTNESIKIRNIYLGYYRNTNFNVGNQLGEYNECKVYKLEIIRKGTDKNITILFNMPIYDWDYLVR